VLAWHRASGSLRPQPYRVGIRRRGGLGRHHALPGRLPGAVPHLEPFRAVYDADLIAASELAPRLGWACRAVNGHVRGEDKATRARLRMFLDGRA
jgi:hypothetical protein